MSMSEAFSISFILSVQFSCSVMSNSVTTWTAARQTSLSITISRILLKLMSIESVMPSNHLILCCPLLLPPSIFPSIRIFSNESALYIRWLKYWSFSFNISPSNEYSGLISFRMNWLDLLTVKGLSRIFSNTTVRKHQFFSAQPSYGPALTSILDYCKNHSFDETYLCQQISLLCNMLSRLVIAFFPRSKRLLISWL